MPIRPSKIREQFRSLWNSHTSPRKIALALALGVFWGSSPFWGLHTLLAIGCCFLFGLNKPAAVLGSLVSNPVLAPFLIFFSLETGSWLLYSRAAHLSLAEVRHHFQSPDFRDILNEYLLPYFVGSLIVGVALAAITFWVSLWVARSYRSVNQQTGGSQGRGNPEGP
jgi:uncharacterized protein (TIGR03546 family)